MDINRIIKIGNGDEKETLSMILSSGADVGSEQGCLISVKAFPDVIKNIIVWKNSLLNEKCNHKPSACTTCVNTCKSVTWVGGCMKYRKKKKAAPLTKKIGKEKNDTETKTE